MKKDEKDRGQKNDKKSEYLCGSLLKSFKETCEVDDTVAKKDVEEAGKAVGEDMVVGEAKAPELDKLGR